MNTTSLGRRDLLRAAALATQAASGAPAQTAQRPAPPVRRKGEQPPNILWVCSDQQRFDTVEGLNNAHIRTPNLKQFMTQACTFTHAFVQNPVCSPSRASFLTGRYPHTTGLCANGQRIRSDERLITRTLADAGYTCGLAGKLHLSPVAGGRLEDRIEDGYSRFDWSHDIQNLWPGHNMWHVWLQSKGVKWPERIPDPGGVPLPAKFMQTDWCADRAIDFMRQQREFGPWLMSVNIYQPHHPFLPAQEFLERYDAEKLPGPAWQNGELASKPVYQSRAQMNASYPFLKKTELERRRVTAAYYAMIEQVDSAFGRMLAALEESGQADNTIVIYMSDHGEMLGDHGFYLKGPHFYDPAMRVPLMIRWPGKYRAGVKLDALVEMIDLAPTLLEATGLPVSEGMQGQSLMPLLTGAASAHRDSVYMEFYDMRRRPYEPVTATTVRSRNARLTVYHNLKTGELYDLARDPGEFTNLWETASARPLREEMMAALISRMAATVDPLPLRSAPW
ncbi:MAG: sulfatase-like hydrolase/transferase [Bryobacteraceae bacterium]|nr:sulfatase-like hydrolase/transferase [Bryobacteraceae bacterium]